MNCLRPELICESRRGKRSNCDCRWCVYNREFCKANRIPDIENG